MRRVFIQQEKGNFINENMFNAYLGFLQMGFEIQYYEGSPPKNLNRSDIVVGWITYVKEALANLGVEVPTEIDYPEELNAYWGRKIWRSNLESVKEEEFPVFIKPVKGKLFDGRLVKSFSDLIGTKKQDTRFTPIWKSEPVKLVTEWRVFVRYGQILDARKYKGSPFGVLNEDTVRNAIRDFKSQPSGYSIDFGVTDIGKTICIEVNDGYSLGCYGLIPTLYAKLICARWSEMVDVYDELSII